METTGKPEMLDERLRAVLAAAPAALGLTADRVFRWVNPYMTEMLGYPADRLVGRSARMLYENDAEFDRVGAERHCRIVRDSVSEVDTRWVAADGRVLDIYLRTTAVDRDDPSRGTVFSAVDVTERRRTDAAVRASEARFRSLIENTDVVAWEMDPATFRFTYVAPHAERMFGYPLASWKAEGFWPRHLHPDDAERVLTICRRESAAGRDHDVEFRMIKADGAVAWVRSIVTVHKDSGGRPVWLSGFLVDIDDRKRMEAALRDSELRFRAIFEQAATGIAQAAPDGHFLRVNRRFCDIVGYDRDDLLGMAFHDITHPDDLAADLDNLRPLLDGTADSFCMEKRYRRRDGSVVWVNLTASVVRDDDGRPRHFIAVVEDIDARKQAEEALRASNERYAFLSDVTLEGVVIHRDGRIVDVNASLCRMLGYERDEVIGAPSESLVDPVSREAVAHHIRDRSEEPYQILGLRKDGSVFPVELEARNVSRGGEVLRIVAVRDLTERKKAEATLRRYTEALERSNADLQQFAYAASHDLQEPLRMVTSYLQLLNRRYAGRLDRDADEFIGFAVDGARRMSRLITDLLEYSRVQTKGREFSRVSATESARAALDNLQLATTESEARIDLAPLPDVLADAGQLTSLFQNLVGNAIKYRAAERTPEVSISAARVEREWVFTVRDNGIGIAPPFHQRIFGIFQRLHRRDEYSGTGIGLAITKRIVERHGGRIWVESEPGAGSAFHFTLAAPPDDGPA